MAKNELNESASQVYAELSGKQAVPDAPIKEGEGSKILPDLPKMDNEKKRKYTEDGYVVREINGQIVKTAFRKPKGAK